LFQWYSYVVKLIQMIRTEEVTHTVKHTGTPVANVARLDMWGRRQRRIPLISHRW